MKPEDARGNVFFYMFLNPNSIMATALVNSADLFQIDSFPNPQLLLPERPSGGSNDGATAHDTAAGVVAFKSLHFPGLHVMNLHWQVERDVTIIENGRADTVNVNFQLSGHMNTRFTGIARELAMKPGKHNLVFSPEGGFRNSVRAGEQVEMFHISVDKQYFADLIGCDDCWAERAHEAMLRERPFTGSEHNPDLTPQIRRLIAEIKQCRETGAMRNLLMHSRALELLSMQLGQMQQFHSFPPGLNAAETDRLHDLKAYLDAHYLEEFTLTQLSRICLLNDFKLKRGFKALFGTTVFAYLRKLRMDFAGNMLLHSSQTIDEISEKLGYEHAHHFSTAFKRYHGVSPSTFRR